MEIERGSESMANTDVSLHAIKIHIYTDTKDLQNQVSKELKNYGPTRHNDDGCSIECFTIQREHVTLSVELVTTEKVHQCVSHEMECDGWENTMVFLTESKALVLNGTTKKTTDYSSLQDMSKILAGILSHEETSGVTNAPRVYKMNSSPVGICMIINNKKFEGDYPDREGTDVDATNLCNIFQKMNFRVVQFHDLTDTDIIREVKLISLKDHTAFDTFVCCILSHGIYGSVLGVNNKPVPILEITSQYRMRGCPSLAEKPKLFFIQACQGQHPQMGVYNIPASDVLPEEEIKRVIPSGADGADFLVACSSEPGYASFRHEEEGSFFINSLLKQLQASPGKPMSAILTEVCGNICKTTFDGNYKQVPWWTSTLTKEVVLPPSRIAKPGEKSDRHDVGVADKKKTS